jgi:L-asparaginase
MKRIDSAVPIGVPRIAPAPASAARSSSFAPAPSEPAGCSRKMQVIQGRGRQQALTDAFHHRGKRIGVINTGGTISCVGTPLRPMSAADFEQACQDLLVHIWADAQPGVALNYVTDLAFTTPPPHTLDSTDLNPDHWCMIARHILENYADHDGWVVLHGTDSLEYSAAALPFLLSMFSKEGQRTAVLSKPVVITGSQKPMFSQDPSSGALSLEPASDAVGNFCGAIKSAQGEQRPEVSVYFDGQLLRANRVRKVSTSKFDAFVAPNYTQAAPASSIEAVPEGSVSSLDDPQVRAKTLVQLDHIQEKISHYPVIPWSAFPAPAGLHARLIDTFLAEGIKGVVLTSYGAGNFPSGNSDQPQAGATYQSLRRAKEAGMLVLNSSQTLECEVDADLYASGAWLKEVDVMSGGNMTCTAALVKLMLLLTAAEHHHWQRSDVKKLIESDLLGEGGRQSH